MERSVVQNWLLNLAVETPCSLGTIFPSVEGEYLNVKEIPGCNSDKYAESLLELFEAGLIALKSDFPEDNVCGKLGAAQIIERFVLLAKDAREIRYVCRKMKSDSVRPTPKRVRFELTMTGGEMWERLAEPDWNRYFHQLADHKSCEIVSQNRDLAMALLGWYQETDGGRVHLNSIQIQKLNDYEILYWKRLPFVFKVNFTSERAEARWSGDGLAWLNEPTWFKEWRTAATHWYTKPWELAAWPSE